MSQNTVYADIDGNIGYLMTGQVPARVRGDGARPGSAGASGWAAPIGGAGALPRGFNPARGFLVTTNNPVVRGDSPFITRDWSGAVPRRPGHRRARRAPADST